MESQRTKFYLMIGFINMKLQHRVYSSRPIFIAWNVIQVTDIEANHLIINSLNCIRCDGHSTSKPGLIQIFSDVLYEKLFGLGCCTVPPVPV